jgi:hypothetical protein
VYGKSNENDNILSYSLYEIKALPVKLKDCVDNRYISSTCNIKLADEEVNVCV